MQHKKLTRLLIMAGGTGGHVFPGLAVAKYFKQNGVQVEWLGTTSGIEAKLVPAAGITLHTIDVFGVRQKGWITKLVAPFALLKAAWQSSRVLKQMRPQVVLGMGGYVSGPGGVASIVSRVPLLIHEQNAIAGLTNKILSHYATKVLEGFPNAFPASADVLTIGNPVREEIEALPPPNVRFKDRQGPLRVLVIGGSLGAQFLNTIVPEALAKIAQTTPISIKHQTGDKHLAATTDAYAKAQVNAELMPFISDMAAAYGWADVVLCRSGALTVAELCAAGVGAFVVPFPYAVDDHQTANANFMFKNGAAICYQQNELSADMLATKLQELANSREICLQMANAAYQLRQPNVVATIYSIAQEICH